MHIYKITNFVNKKIYIGLSVSSTNERWKSHLWNARKNSNQAIDRAIFKYGKKNFKYEIIEKVPFKRGIRYLENREIFYISKYKSNKSNIGYNRSLGGNVNVAKKISNKHKLLASNSQPSMKPIFAYNFSGNLVRSFTNIREAARFNGVTVGSIFAALNKKKRNGISKNYQWRQFDNDIPAKKIKKFKIRLPHNVKKIYQWNKTGKLLNEYTSIAEAANKLNLKPGSIGRVLKGVNMYTGGMHFTKSPSYKAPRKKRIVSGNSAKTIIKVNVYDFNGKLIDTVNGVSKTGIKYGCDPSEISKCILNKKRAHKFKNGKILQFKKYKKNLRKIKPLKKTLHGPRQILMYSLDGHFLKLFNSIIEAVNKTGVSRGKIRHSVKYSTFRGGNYIWRYKNGKINKKIKAAKDTRVKVLKYDFKGNFIKEFKTIKHAADSVKTNTANIQRCIDKKGYSSHQYYWFRKKGHKIKKKIQVPIFI